jgi:hypothetical protein
MARWLALVLAAACAESIPDRALSLTVESTAADCPRFQPGPTFSTAGEPPCSQLGRRCYYGAIACQCERRDPTARWGCVRDECRAPSGACEPGTKCDYGFEDSEVCNSYRVWISTRRR